MHRHPVSRGTLANTQYVNVSGLRVAGVRVRSCVACVRVYVCCARERVRTCGRAGEQVGACDALGSASCIPQQDSLGRRGAGRRVLLLRPGVHGLLLEEEEFITRALMIGSVRSMKVACHAS